MWYYTGMKTCRRCKKEKLSEKFHKDNRQPDGLFIYCKKCRRFDSHEHYENNKVVIKKRVRKAVLRYRERNQKFLLEYLGKHPCVDCGESDVVVLEFDHIKGDKKKGVAKMVREGLSLQTIQKEIDKCEVVCANCHKKRTYSRANSYRCK